MILFYFGARLGIHTIDLGKRTFSETLGGLLIQCRIDKSKLTLRLKVNWDGEGGKDSNICNKYYILREQEKDKKMGENEMNKKIDVCL